MSDAVISRRKLVLVLIAIAVALLLASCTQAPVIPSLSPTSVAPATSTPQPSPTSAPSQTATATSTVKPPIPQPSITAEPWPTLAITLSSALLSPDNINKVQQLAQFGMGTISDAALSADGTLLVVGSTTGIHLYDPLNLKLLRVIPAQQPVDRVVLSYDGRRLMSMELWSKGLPIWDTATGKLLKRLDTWTGSQHLAAFSPDGSLVALAEEYENKPIQLWDMTSGKITGTLAGHDDGVRKLAFSPDGRLLASASWFDNVQIWDAKGRRRLWILPHERGVGALAFTPDGRNLVTADRPWQDETDGVLRLWDMETGKYLRSIVSDTVELDALQFSLDGSLLAGVGRHNILHLWDVVTGELL
jgi:WD40 repeat protein